MFIIGFIIIAATAAIVCSRLRLRRSRLSHPGASLAVLVVPAAAAAAAAAKEAELLVGGHQLRIQRIVNISRRVLP